MAMAYCLLSPSGHTTHMEKGKTKRIPLLRKWGKWNTSWLGMSEMYVFNKSKVISRTPTVQKLLGEMHFPLFYNSIKKCKSYTCKNSLSNPTGASGLFHICCLPVGYIQKDEKKVDLTRPATRIKTGHPIYFPRHRWDDRLRVLLQRRARDFYPGFYLLDLLRGESSRGQKGPFFPTLCLFSVI